MTKRSVLQPNPLTRDRLTVLLNKAVETNPTPVTVPARDMMDMVGEILTLRVRLARAAREEGGESFDYRIMDKPKPLSHDYANEPEPRPEPPRIGTTPRVGFDFGKMKVDEVAGLWYGSMFGAALVGLFVGWLAFR